MPITNIYCSNVPRATATAREIEEVLKKLWIETSFKIRNMFWYFDERYFPPKINEEFIKHKAAWEKEDIYVEDFLDGKWENKPETLAIEYIKMLKAFFNRVNNVIKKDFSIIAFRHWDKSSDGNLSELWKKQAKELWQKLSKEKYDEDVMLIATHNIINESIIRCLISKDDLPQERRKPLAHTETVKYTFHPSEEKENLYMEIEWRNTKVKIPYKKIEEVIKDLTK